MLYITLNCALIIVPIIIRTQLVIHSGSSRPRESFLIFQLYLFLFLRLIIRGIITVTPTICDTNRNNRCSTTRYRIALMRWNWVGIEERVENRDPILQQLPQSVLSKGITYHRNTHQLQIIIITLGPVDLRYFYFLKGLIRSGFEFVNSVTD